MTWKTTYDRAQELLVCAADELDANATANSALVGAPDYRFFAPGGLLVADNCCDCGDDDCGGQLYVRVVRAHPVSPVPTKVLREVPCRDPIGVQLAVGVFRCAHEDPKGEAPPAEDLNADSNQMLADMAALLRALECCDTDDERTTVDQWLPQGPAGGCVGGEWTFWWTPRIDIPEEESI